MQTIRHLRALQIFDKVATYQNLSLAADSLSITQGAVSRQIRLLEEYLNVRLFERTARGVVRTAAGEQLHYATGQAFSILENGLEQYVRRKKRTSITISLNAGLATKWLVPRLQKFRALYPKIKIFLDTSDELVDFSDSNNCIDGALRFSKTVESNLFSMKIADESLILVASPRLVADMSFPTTPSQIMSLPILADLHDDRWDDWCALTKTEIPKKERTPIISFLDSTVMISAAIHGQGIALARKILVADDLRAGHLVRLDDVEVSIERSLNFVCERRDANCPILSNFYQWILSEGCQNNSE